MSEPKFDGKQYIYNLYKKSGYLDINSPFIICFYILIVFLISFICYINVLINTIPIRDNWENEKCNPTVMPFAGLINTPENKTMLEFTSENYNQCMKHIVKNVSDYQLTPFYYILSQVTTLFSSFMVIFQAIRGMFDIIRTQFAIFNSYIYSKTLNTTIHTERLLNDIMAVNGKAQATFVSGAYFINTGLYLSRTVTGIAINGVLNIIIGIGILLQFLMATFMYIPAFFIALPYTIMAVGYGMVASILSIVLQIQLGIKK